MRKLQQEVTKPLYNADAERIVIAGLLQHGIDKYYDIQSLLDASDFYLPENNAVYTAIEKLAEKKINKFDKLLVIEEIKNIDNSLIAKYEIATYLDILRNEAVNNETVDNFAKIIARNGLKRTLVERLTISKNIVQSSPDDESILKTVGNVEKTLFDFQSKLLNNNEQTIEIGKNTKSLIEQLAEQPRLSVGIPTGFSLYDKAIGGGIRGPGVAVIGSRSKVGKSFAAIQIGINITLQGIPILYLDTEMNEQDTTIRIIANLAQVDMNIIETGRFTKNTDDYNKIKKAVDLIENIPFHYRNVSGYSHNQIIATIRRWLNKSVGFDTYGNLKPCLVILDYIKTMNLGELGNNQEYQYLGQYLTDLHNFCVPYKLPILAFIQLNRDGIDREDAGAIAGSDRILWLCTSFSILKKKTSEDFVSDPVIFGDRKIIIDSLRYGPGLEYKEYINIISNLSKATMKEGQTNINNKGSKDQSLLEKPIKETKKKIVEPQNEPEELSI